MKETTNFCKPKTLFFVIIVAFMATFCGKKENSNADFSKPSEGANTEISDAGTYDPKRGEGKFDKVDLGAGLDKSMADKGQKVAEVKCTSCHKITNEKLVGPGWQGVTSRHSPEWIMNFITNPDPMIDKDPVLKQQLEICLVRMPNQGLTDDEARNILEYMRKIDGVE